MTPFVSAPTPVPYCPRRPLPFFLRRRWAPGLNASSTSNKTRSNVSRQESVLQRKSAIDSRGGVDHHRNGVLLGEEAKRAEQRRGQELAEHGVRRSRVFGNPRENPSTGLRRPSGPQRAHEARGVPRRQTPRPRSGPGSGTEGWGQCFFEGGWYTGVLWGGKGRHGPGDGSRARA